MGFFLFQKKIRVFLILKTSCIFFLRGVDLMWISNTIYIADTTSLMVHHLPGTVKYNSLLRRKPPVLNVTQCHNVKTMGDC